MAENKNQKNVPPQRAPQKSDEVGKRHDEPNLDPDRNKMGRTDDELDLDLDDEDLATQRTGKIDPDSQKPQRE